jgi:uncharacterized membrane protein YphA (DoxX/SURF4 family)
MTAIGFGWAAGVVLAARVVLGLVFVYSGLVKIWQPFDFLDAVYGYELTGRVGSVAVATIVPWAEVVLGVTLLAGLLREAAMGVSLVVLLGFVALQGWAIARGLQVPCGCFGSSSGGEEATLVGVASLTRTGVLALLAAAGWCAVWSLRRRQEMDGVSLARA